MDGSCIMLFLKGTLWMGNGGRTSYCGLTSYSCVCSSKQTAICTHLKTSLMVQCNEVSSVQCNEVSSVQCNEVSGVQSLSVMKCTV